MSVQIGLYLDNELVAIWPHNETSVNELETLLWALDGKRTEGFEARPVQV